MRAWLLQLDSILRGDATDPGRLRQSGMQMPVGGLLVVLLALALLYGACMGSYSVFRTVETGESARDYLQLFATMLKTPALFFLTLIITFPSLYVFNALVGSRLRFREVLGLLIFSLAVNLAVLAALGPIVAFFSVSTKSYSFMVLFNVVMFAVAGFLGLMFLVQTLNRLSHALALQAEPPTIPPSPVAAVQAEGISAADSGSAAPSADPPGAGNTPGAGDTPGAGNSPETGNAAETGGVPPTESAAAVSPLSKKALEFSPLDVVDGQVLLQRVRIVFRCWLVVFGLVGAQMGWVLRPFIGDPKRPFSWFRERDSNFFEAAWASLLDLLS